MRGNIFGPTKMNLQELMLKKLDDEIEKVDKNFIKKYRVDPRITSIKFNVEKSFSAKIEKSQNAQDNHFLINSNKFGFSKSPERKKVNYKQFDNINLDFDDLEDTILYTSNENFADLNENVTKNEFKIDFIRENNDNNIYNQNPFLYKKNKNNSPAEKNDLQRSKNFDSKDINFLILKATSLLQKRKLDKLESILEYARLKGVRHSDVDYLLGETKRLKGNYLRAKELLQKAITYDIHSPFGYFSLALCYKSLQNTDKAIHYLKRFLSLKNDTNLKALKELINCYLLKKEDVQAALIATKAIEKFDDPELFLIRGKIYQGLNYLEYAKKDFDEYEKSKKFIKK